MNARTWQIAGILDLTAGSCVLVLITNPKVWEETFLRFIFIEGDISIVQLPTGRSILRSICVRPWVLSHLKYEGTKDRRTIDGQDLM